MSDVIADFDRCYRAVLSRDTRFDGWFFTAVKSPGIYCRPSCSARTPKPSNVTFFVSAAAAQRAGYRACKRCRPDTTPGSPLWRQRADVIGRGMQLIADGVVDREGVGGLAARLGYSERHLRRLMLDEIGAGPLSVARAQRAQTARILIETTALPFADVAFAAGFASIREFNETVKAVFAVSPSMLRAAASKRAGDAAPNGALNLRLSARTPFDGHEALAFLGARAIPGVETYDGITYERSLALPHGSGHVSLQAKLDHVAATLQLDDLRDLTAAVARCRRLVDLDADPVAVSAQLGRDRDLGPVVRKSPGRRVPGAVDGFELACRAVIGQQVSVAGARTLAGRLVERCGTAPLFPSADAIAVTDLTGVGLTTSRVRTLRALAEANLELEPGVDRHAAVAALQALPGIGQWTASYIAMRALGDPDVFLDNDIGVRRGLTRLGLDPNQSYERWRPWRSYAVVHLWSV